MRVLLAPAGSRGDVAPLVALGVGLRARGHEVFVVAPTGMGSYVTERGLPCVEAGSDIVALLAAHQHELHNPVAVMRILVAGARRELRAQIDAIAPRAAEFDLIVGAGVQIAAPSIGAALGVPTVTVLYTPSALPGPDTAPFWLPFRDTPRWLNPWLHLLPDRVNGLLALGELQRWRRAHGLVPEPFGLYAMIGAHPLLAMEPALAAAPSTGWPRARSVGWLRPPDEPPLDAELLRFLDAGPPPVYLGYGSMVDGDAAGTLAMVAAMVRRLGVRAIVCRGWSAAVAVPEVDGLLVIDGAPHTRLLPRCAAAVHHGGAGTTQAAAYAGIPQLVVPHLLDQFDNAAHVARAGLGPTAVKRRALDLDRLCAAVDAMLGDDAMRARCAAFGEAMRARDGVGCAIDALVVFVAAYHASPIEARAMWVPAVAPSPPRPPPSGLPTPGAPLPAIAQPRPPWRRPAVFGLVLGAAALLAAVIAMVVGLTGRAP